MSEGPKNETELEIWTRFACAATACPAISDSERFADAMLAGWRTRRDAIEAAKREAEAERVAEIRAALNAAPWVSYDSINRARSAMDKTDHVLMPTRHSGSPLIWRFERSRDETPGFYATEWPADMGAPPPGWGAP